MPKQQLIDFLVKMSNDPRLCRQVEQDPVATFEAAGLSQQDIDVLMTKDPDKIRRYIGPPVLCEVPFLRPNDQQDMMLAKTGKKTKKKATKKKTTKKAAKKK